MQRACGVAIAIVIAGCGPKAKDLFASASSGTTPMFDMLSKQRGVQSAKVVRLDASNLREARLRFQLDGGAVIGKRVRIEQHAASFTWFGTLDGGGSAIFVVRNDAVTGTIRHGADVYLVRSVGGGLHAIAKLDRNALQPFDPPTAPASRLPRLLHATPSLGRPVPIRLIVGYTPAVTASWTSVEDLIQLAIDESNLANDNSNVRIHFELAHSYETQYVESGDSNTDLVRFGTKNDNVMDEVHALRDQHAADIAIVLTEANDWCGLATDIHVTEDKAFAMVAQNCAVGYFVLAHEIGHLFGARHDRDRDPTTTPYAYGHGFKHASTGSGDPAWRTVMAYDCTPRCMQIAHWSNPRLTYNGHPTGTKEYEDNARVMNENACEVSLFRGPKACGPACDVLFRDFNIALGAMLHYCMSAPVDPACFDDGCPIDVFGTTGPVRRVLDSLGAATHIGLDPRIRTIGQSEASSWLKTQPSLLPLIGSTPSLPRGGGLGHGQFCDGMASQVTAMGHSLQHCGQAPP